MCYQSWPKPPIWPEDLPLIRELLTDEEYADLLGRMVQVLPNGPLQDYSQAFGEQELKAPNAAGTVGAFCASHDLSVWRWVRRALCDSRCRSVVRRSTGQRLRNQLILSLESAAVIPLGSQCGRRTMQ